MVHDTMKAFGYPQTVVRDYAHWCVALRPRQATLGALVLLAKEEATAFSELTPDSFAELPCAVRDIEAALEAAFDCDKLNYLMLMMVDPHVHFHVLPRYREQRIFKGATFADPGWPGPPRLDHDNACGVDVTRALIERLRAVWPPSEARRSSGNS